MAAHSVSLPAFWRRLRDFQGFFFGFDVFFWVVVLCEVSLADPLAGAAFDDAAFDAVALAGALGVAARAGALAGPAGLPAGAPRRAGVAG